MKARFYIPYLFIFFSSVCLAQKGMEKEDIFSKSLNSIYQNPEQTIKVANYLLEHANSQPEKAKAYYLLSKSKMLTENNNEAVEDLFKAKEVLRKNESPFISSLVFIELAHSCRIAGLQDISSSYLVQAKRFIEKITSKRETTIARAMFLNQQVAIYLDENNVKGVLKSIEEFDSISNTEITKEKALIQTTIGHYYLNNHKIDSSEVHFKKAIALLRSSEIYNSTIEASSLAGLGNIYMMKDDLQNSLQYFNDALKILPIKNFTKIEILEKLSHLYKLTDSIVLSQKYYNEKVALNASWLTSERKFRSAIISHIEIEQQHMLQNDRTDYYMWGTYFVALFLLILIGYYFMTES